MKTAAPWQGLEKHSQSILFKVTVLISLGTLAAEPAHSVIHLMAGPARAPTTLFLLMRKLSQPDAPPPPCLLVPLGGSRASCPIGVDVERKAASQIAEEFRASSAFAMKSWDIWNESGSFSVTTGLRTKILRWGGRGQRSSQVCGLFGGLMSCERQGAVEECLPWPSQREAHCHATRCPTRLCCLGKPASLMTKVLF